MSLSQKKTKVIYCFDASAFIELSKTNSQIIKLPVSLWDHLELMMKSGEIISHRLVYCELCDGKRRDFISNWASTKSKYFLPKSQSQILYVKEIIKKFPNLIDYKREKDQADPWIIALALENSVDTLFDKNKAVVVTQENPKSSQKIPAVCKFFNIDHSYLRNFFDDIGLRTELKK